MKFAKTCYKVRSARYNKFVSSTPDPDQTPWRKNCRCRPRANRPSHNANKSKTISLSAIDSSISLAIDLFKQVILNLRVVFAIVVRTSHVRATIHPDDPPLSRSSHYPVCRKLLSRSSRSGSPAADASFCLLQESRIVTCGAVSSDVREVEISSW